MDKIFKNLVTIITILSFSGCAILPPKSCSDRHLMHAAPKDSFVKILVFLKDGIASGSGVIVGHIDNTNTVILTVKHICDQEAQSVSALDVNEEEFPAVMMINSNNDDLCLIITKNKINKPAVKIAKKQLSYGDRVLNLAAPLGIHAPDMTLMFTGFYDGKLKIPEEKYKLDVFSIPGKGGSSGSPIFNEDWEVVGVISRGMVNFENVMLAVTLTRIQKLMSITEDQRFKDSLKNPTSYHQIED